MEAALDRAMFVARIKVLVAQQAETQRLIFDGIAACNNHIAFAEERKSVLEGHAELLRREGIRRREDYFRARQGSREKLQALRAHNALQNKAENDVFMAEKCLQQARFSLQLYQDRSTKFTEELREVELQIRAEMEKDIVV